MDVLLSELIECKDIVDWEPTFDNSAMEPMYLPAKLPLLLVNGCAAISVGDKIDIPSHNLNEVIDATIALIKNPDANIILVPDHCQKCEIIDTDWASISNGYGTYKVRGIIEIDQYNGVNKRYKGWPTLVIRSCPNLTYLEKINDKIEDMIKNNKIIGIADVEENSGDNDMRYTLILKPGTDPNFVRNEIYKNTSMLQTARIKLKVLDCLDKKEPTKIVSYKGYLKGWIEFRKITKLRYLENKLQKIMTRYHMVSNYIWAIQSGVADKAIDIIKKQKNIDDNALVEELVKKCGITDLQAKFFMNCEIKKLSKGYLNKFIEEEKRLNEQANYCRDSVLIPGRIENIIIEELLEIKAKYGKPRQCRIIKESEANGIPSGEFKVIITENNFIKKCGINDNITGIHQGDSVKFVLNGQNDKSLLLFDSMGKVFNLPISKIPFSDRNSSGVDIRILNKYVNAQLTTVIYEPVIEQFKDGCIVTLTRNGYIKRMSMKDFLAVPPSGLVYGKLDEGDSIIDVLLFNSNANVIVYSKNKVLGLSIDEIPLLKRNARGNVSMGGAEYVEGLSIISHKTKYVVTVTRKGYVNKIGLECINMGRSKRGSNVIKLSKGDSIVSVLGITGKETIRCITTDNGNAVDIPVSNIKDGSSISTGDRMISGRTEVAKVFFV